MKCHSILFPFEILTIVWLICFHSTSAKSNQITDILTKFVRKKLDKAEFKNLELNRWTLPCRMLAGSRESDDQGERIEERQFATGLAKLPEYAMVDILRTSAVLQCTILSESFQLPYDAFVDFTRAVTQVQYGNPSMQEMFFRVLFLPFTLIVSIKDLFIKMGAYTAVAVLPLFW